MITNGISDLLHSERGVFCIMALLCATGLAAFQQLDSAAWLDFVKWLATILVAGKTITSAVETLTLKSPQIPRANTVDNAPSDKKE